MSPSNSPILNILLVIKNYIFRIFSKPLPEMRYPQGHYYSPIHSVNEIKNNCDRIYNNLPQMLAGIDLNADGQMRLFENLKLLYATQPFFDIKTENLRYFFRNGSYSYTDAIILHCMIRHLKPKRIIEIGAGFSSAAMLDTNEFFLNSNIDFTFIEPHPSLLKTLVKPSDKLDSVLLESKLQDVDFNIFKQLAKNDILFIDSTHVSKIFSDVNFVFFEILPLLQPGVYVHFHDIFYPFEYPKEWVYQGVAWNEAYMLRAFLQYNTQFKIAFFARYFQLIHGEYFFANMPLCLENPGGHIWLEKL